MTDKRRMSGTSRKRDNRSVWDRVWESDVVDGFLKPMAIIAVGIGLAVFHNRLNTRY